MLGKAVDQAEKLGGMGAQVAAGLEELTGKEARTVVLGHLLRGGSPTRSTGSSGCASARPPCAAWPPGTTA